MADKDASRESVWAALAGVKARHSATQEKLERDKETARLRRVAVSALEQAFAAAGREGRSDGAEILRAALAPGARDPAIVAMMDDQRRQLADATDAYRDAEAAELLKLQRKAVADLAKARRVLSRIADEREAADSRAGRLEYKVRG